MDSMNQILLNITMVNMFIKMTQINHDYQTIKSNKKARIRKNLGTDKSDEILLTLSFINHHSNEYLNIKKEFDIIHSNGYLNENRRDGNGNNCIISHCRIYSDKY